MQKIHRKERCEAKSLYLRPFSSTDFFAYQIDAESSENELEETSIDIERRIAENMEDLSPLYALGKPGEHIGARRLPVDTAEWKVYVESLIDHCSVTFANFALLGFAALVVHQIFSIW